LVPFARQRWRVLTAVPVVDGALVDQALDPELRDATIADFPLGVLGVIGEHEGVEAVSGDHPANPSAAVRGPSRGLRDVEVVAQFEVVGFAAYSLAPFLVNTIHAYITRSHSYLGSPKTSSGFGKNPENLCR
jgi:hypothetical protein